MTLKEKYYGRIIGLIVLLAGLSIFLTGCFDLDQEVWITADPENSYMRATITTTSEEIYNLLKESMSEEYREPKIHPLS